MRRAMIYLVYGLCCLSALWFAYQAWEGFTNSLIVVEWQTASEVDLAGYNILRNDSADGIPQKVNPELIPASSDPLVGGSYRYEDRTVKPGKTYYYQLESVEMNGATRRFGPVEAKSAHTGWLELLIAVLLAAIGGLGFWQRDRQLRRG